MSNKNLVIIDYQNDFVALDGGLTCGEPAIAIENNIVNKIQEYKSDNIFVTFDTHIEDNWKEDSETLPWLIAVFVQLRYGNSLWYKALTI